MSETKQWAIGTPVRIYSGVGPNSMGHVVGAPHRDFGREGVLVETVDGGLAFADLENLTPWEGPEKTFQLSEWIPKQLALDTTPVSETYTVVVSHWNVTQEERFVFTCPRDACRCARAWADKAPWVRTTRVYMGEPRCEGPDPEKWSWEVAFIKGLMTFRHRSRMDPEARTERYRALMNGINSLML